MEGLSGPSARHDRPRAMEALVKLAKILIVSCALGLGTPMTGEALDAWAQDAVDLFLNGCRGPEAP